MGGESTRVAFGGFGGMTRTMLHDMPAFVFMSH
jgi:hypothetical protein